MMMLFYIPGFIWRKLNKNSGIDTKVITSLISGIDALDSEKRKGAITSLAKHIDQGLAYHRNYRHGFM